MTCPTPCEPMLLASETVTECMCLGDGPVMCRLHGCEKTAHFHKLCKNDPRYFRLWQEGKGPGQVKSLTNALPLGTWLANAIKFVTFGKVSPCTGCQSRAAALDRFGAKVAQLGSKFRARE